MEAHLSKSELNGDRRGKVAAGLGFILIIVLLLIPIFFKLNPPPGQPGIAVLLAFDDQGSGDDPGGPTAPEPVVDPTPTPPPPPAPEVKPAPRPAPPPPASAPRPAPQQRDVIQEESTAEIAIRKQKAREEAAKADAERKRREQQSDIQRREEAAAQAARDKAARERAEQAAREAAIAEANAKAEADRKRRAVEAAELRNRLGGSFGGGGGAGNDNKPGSEGSDDGIRNGSVTAGSGRGNVKGFGNRGVVASPPVRDNSQQAGVIVMAVCIGPDGRIISARFTQAGSQNATPELRQQAETNAKTWRFAADPAAPPSQCGTITYNFKVQ
jgi:colicin import membrane protein